jgi:hypothetical protein
VITIIQGAFRKKGEVAGGYTQGALIHMLNKPGMPSGLERRRGQIDLDQKIQMDEKRMKNRTYIPKGSVTAPPALQTTEPKRASAAATEVSPITTQVLQKISTSYAKPKAVVSGHKRLHMITTNRGGFRDKADGIHGAGKILKKLNKPNILVIRNGDWSRQKNTYKNLPNVVRWKDTLTGEEGVVAITIGSNKRKTADIIRKLMEQ